MTTSLQKEQQSNTLKRIKVKGNVDEGREVIARRATATVKGKDSNLSPCFGLRVTNGFDGRGEIGMKVFKKKVSDLEGIKWTHKLFKFSTQNIPCEGNCPYMVVTDTLNCRKELEGLVDMEEVRETGRCSFWPHEDLETKRKGKNIRSS